ncbi:phage integrase SAM-like domain-containing protein [Bacteroides reticulotermitis]|uniref:phage integrase SAM-like domain-containing protein n=1 Tax=Bacteroides reticulotermitis TaxID=1133319 RepID=UPI003A89BB97
MKISIIIDKRRELKNGEFPIKIKLFDYDRSIYIPTKYSSTPEFFDEISGLFYILDKKTRSHNMQKNADLLSVVDEIQELYDRIIVDLGKVTPEKLREIYLNGETEEVKTLNQCFSEFINTKQGRTKEIYQATLNKIERYFGNEVLFREVNYKWLETLDSKLTIEPVVARNGKVMKIGLGVNARSIHFRNIRSVFNYAINNEVIPLNLYPFRRFKIKSEDTIKRAIGIDSLRLIFGYDGCDENCLFGRDMAMLIFGLIGINLVDLYNLSDITDTHITYKRAKTGRVYNIKLEPEIKAVIDKYRVGDGLVFSDTMLRKSFLRRVNSSLKKLTSELSIKSMTSYSLRHSWATIAAELEIPKETISAALGHSDKSVTNIYINFNQKKIDEANRKVIDYVNGAGLDAD